MFEPLHTLLCSARAPAAAFARSDGALIDFAAFRRRAAQWQAAAEAHAASQLGLYLKDSAEFAAALFGLWHAGKTVWLPGDALPATLAALGAEVQGLVGDVPQPAFAPGSAEATRQPLDPQARQLVIFTSGSTGAPQPIVKRLGQLFDEVTALEQTFGARAAGGEVLATVSHQHIYGLLFRVLWPLAAGRVLQAERLAFLEDLARLATRPVLLIASPAHLKRLPALAFDRTQLLSVFSSGGPLPDAALPDCRALLGQAPIEVFGSSETGGVAWRQRQQDDQLRWQPLPGVQWRLLDGERLEVRSPHLDTDGWQPSADRAAADGEGFLLLGRADTVLKVEEKRVSPAAIEAALQGSGLVDEARVLLLPASAGARSPLAVVARPSVAGWAVHDESGKNALATALRGTLAAVIEAVALPRRWRFVHALPHNAQGKTTVQALTALFDPRRPQPRVLEADAARAVLRLTPAAALPQFDGHFPGHPVLPGVAQLEWAILFGRELFPQLPPQFIGMEVLKFQQIIPPGLEVQLTLECKAETGKLAFSYTSARGPHAAGRVLFGAAS